MNDYRTLFQSRAKDYHFAMQKYSEARDNEFNSLIKGVDFTKVQKVLDIPSGGGYLKNYIPSFVNLQSADFSEGFVEESIKLVSPQELPFDSETYDIVFSLSGMHHLTDVPQFVRECLRILNSKGTFIFADVKKDSKVDYFLNEFVNEYNSLGHEGNFFYEDFFTNHSDIQNRLLNCTYNEYPFKFKNMESMTHFFKLFFGLDKATEKNIRDGVQDILGIQKKQNMIEVNWGLLQFQFKK